MGNCSGKYGPSACGSLGYAFSDAMHANKVVVLTDNLVPYPLKDTSINEGYVDYVVEVPQIGDPARIVSGTTKITRDPVGLRIAGLAAQVVKHSGYLKDGFSFQTGAGGASLAVAKYVEEMMEKENIKGSFCMGGITVKHSGYLKDGFSFQTGAGGASLAVAKYVEEMMEKENIKGSFCMGGITGYMVDMANKGYFDTILDVQCFDLKAIESIRENPKHQEISAMRYASPAAKSAAVDSLDVVILGATQVDVNFNVNVHTDSNGFIMGGSGGHCDTAAGSKLAIIVAPLIRARLPLIVDEVLCKSTPGETVDVVVTQRGIAVNPKQKELKEKLLKAGLPVKDIEELKQIAEDIAGVPNKIQTGDKVVAKVLYRDGTLLDTIKNVL